MKFKINNNSKRYYICTLCRHIICVDQSLSYNLKNLNNDVITINQPILKVKCDKCGFYIREEISYEMSKIARNLFSHNIEIRSISNKGIVITSNKKCIDDIYKHCASIHEKNQKLSNVYYSIIYSNNEFSLSIWSNNKISLYEYLNKLVELMD